MRFDHVTAVVADVETASAALERVVGAPPIGEVTLTGMRIRTFRVGESEIHVNAPTGPGPVDDFLRKHGPGLHHLALRVDDLDSCLAALAALGVRTLGEPVETAPGLREVFVDPTAVGGLMVQLVERRGDAAHTALPDGARVEALVAQTISRS